MTFRDRVGRATITQPMFGMSAPSVKVAEPIEDIRFALAMGSKDNEPQFTRSGYFSALRFSTSNLRSAAGVLECTYLAPICDYLCGENKRTQLGGPGNWRTGFAEPGLYN